MRITYEILKKQGARCAGLERFKQLFPNGAEVTQENLLLAAKALLNLHWFVSACLPKSLQAEYQRQQASLRDEYKCLRAPPWDAYRCLEALLIARLLKVERE